MRIAISGTHGVGKSTLIDEFLRTHREFTHEPEPYTVLVEDFGEEFAAEPQVEDFRRQLAFNIDRVKQHKRGEQVIYERCPADFLAYIDALEPQSAEALLDPAVEAMQNLDLIVFLPLDANSTEAEYPKLRKAVDRRLHSLLIDDELGMIKTRVVEATGSTAQRLRIVVDAFTLAHQTRNPVTSRKE